MVESKLPPGFRFHPRDEELICDYLMNKVAGSGSESDRHYPLLIEVDLNKSEPWEIPGTLFFLSHRISSLKNSGLFCRLMSSNSHLKLILRLDIYIYERHYFEMMLILICFC